MAWAREAAQAVSGGRLGTQDKPGALPPTPAPASRPQWLQDRLVLCPPRQTTAFRVSGRCAVDLKELKVLVL